MSARVIALGFFDGVHRGHQLLLKKAVRLARRLHCTAAALSFAGSVAGKPTLRLNTLEDRRFLLQRICGVEEMLVLTFDEALMRMAPEQFVNMLVREYGAVHLLCGHDFTYGYRGAGNAETLKAQCASLGIGCTVLDPVEAEGIRISSRGIRALVGEGKMEAAAELLGHPHVLTAEVERGYQLGRTMGCPTANQRFPRDIVVPAKGVYAARVILPDGRAFPAAANIGTRPTVSDSDAVTLESHILGFSGDLYGKTLRTELYARLRPETRFESKQALFAQIRADGENVLRWFAENRTKVMAVDSGLREHAEAHILPEYTGFDRGHDVSHVREVTETALELAFGYDLEPDMVYCMAVYHDLGMAQGRKTHHLTSAVRLREDACLRTWFSEEQIETMAQAVEDHRASAEMPPRSLYGKLLCDADRCLKAETVIRRTLDFGAVHYPGLSEAEQFARLREHLEEKYSENGYLRLQLGAEKTLRELEELRRVIRDDRTLRELFEAWLNTEKSGKIN